VEAESFVGELFPVPKVEASKLVWLRSTAVLFEADNLMTIRGKKKVSYNPQTPPSPKERIPRLL